MKESIRATTYDLDGNMVQCGDWIYAYDSANRLQTVSSNGVAHVTNFYDAKSRRVKKVTAEATTTFFYDDWNLIEEGIAYTNGTSSTIHYYWGKDISGTLQGAGGIGGLLYLMVDGEIYIPCYDANGNITRYLDATGNTVAEYTYDAFGNSLSQSGLLADWFRHRFSTKYFDVENELYYYGYRFYHPVLMRWLNRDHIEEDGGENLYVFCQNNAIFYYDPNGESFEDVSNFCAGVGDSLTFGLTRLFRRGLNRVIEGTWDDPADVESTAYFAGEVTEVSVEIALTLGGATLRHAAKTTSRVAVERGARSAYRKAHGLVGKGGEVHHINPIKGHPYGKKARYPLPYDWAAKGEWNMTWYASRTEHHAAHARMQMLETIDKYRESTLLTRQTINAIINHLNSSEETKCWDAIDVQTSIFHMEYESYGTHLNAVPESITIQLR